MSKCDNCDKNITKKCPGLECRQCGKMIHASPICSGLTGKQLSAIRNSESLDWICQECNRDSPRRKSSFIIPEEDDEEEDKICGIGGSVDLETILQNITKEVKKTIRAELVPMELSVKNFGQKIDEIFKQMRKFEGKLQDLERKNTQLMNKNTNLEIKIGSLEELIQKMEQNYIENKIEITGIPKINDNENVKEMSLKIAKLLNVDHHSIKTVKRSTGRNDSSGPLQVELTDGAQAVSWVRAAKKTNIVVENIIPGIQKAAAAKSKVIVRHALTKANKALLWNSQQKLRPAFKFVWYQNGNVLTRKDDNDKPIAIGRQEDIAKILSLA